MSEFIAMVVGYALLIVGALAAGLVVLALLTDRDHRRPPGRE